MYSVDDIKRMELTILQSLSWHIYASDKSSIETFTIRSLVISNATCTQYLQESITWEHILNEVNYQTELIVTDYGLSIYSINQVH